MITDSLYTIHGGNKQYRDIQIQLDSKGGAIRVLIPSAAYYWYGSRATYVDRCQEPSIRLLRFSSSLRSKHFVVQHQRLVAAGTRVPEEVRQNLGLRHAEMAAFGQIHATLHEFRDVKLHKPFCSKGTGLRFS